MDQDFRTEIRATPEQTLAAIGEAAEMWGAPWEVSEDGSPRGGRLHLPVLAGIRSGSVLARAEVSATKPGSALVLRVEDSDYRVNRPAALFLALGALGGVVAMLWPLFPNRLLLFMPLALVLMIGSWLLIASRLRTAGPEDFLDTVAELAEEEPIEDEALPGSSPIEP